MISAKVIADSKNEFGNRITTMVVTMPRIILAEFNTHRMFSRNSASSRAIPFEKMIEAVETNPFVPLAWQRDHRGMQGTEYKTDDEIMYAQDEWLAAKDNAVHQAKRLSEEGVTKQLCNRLLEPFMYHTCIITATEFKNFFALRCPQYKVWLNDKDYTFRSRKDTISWWNENAPNQLSKEKLEEYSDLDWLLANKGQAEIHMMALAEAIWDAYNESTPKELKAGEWHIPFGDQIDYGKLRDMTLENLDEDIENLKIKIATARCARVSYTVVGEEGKRHDYKKDIELHDRLAKSGHWSPFEHCAKAMEEGFLLNKSKWPVKSDMEWSGNFQGWIQYRKMFENENITV